MRKKLFWLRTGIGACLLAQSAAVLASKANEEWIVKGRQAMAKNDLEQARNLFESAAKKDNNDAEAPYYLATVLLQMGRTQEGFNALQQSIRVSPKNVGLRMVAGDLYALHRDYQSAIEQFRVVLKLSPPNDKNAEAANKKISITMVNRHMSDGDIDSASFLLTSLLEQYPNDEFLQMTLAKLLVQSDKLMDAEEAINDLLKLNPNNLEAHIELAMLYQKQGRLDKSQLHLMEVVKRDPKGDAGKQAALSLALQRNNDLVKQGRVKDALANYQEMLQFDPNNPVALVNVAELSYQLKQLDLAQKAYERLTQVSPNDAQVRFKLGRIYFEKKMLDPAVAELEAVVRLSGDNELGRQAKSNLQTLYQQRAQGKGGNEIKEQLAKIDDVLKSNPSDVNARLEKANLYIREQNLEKARQELERAVSIDPKNLTAMLRLGAVYEDIGLTSEAGIAYAKVSALDKEGKIGQQATLRVISLGAKRLFNEGKLDEAKREFLNIIEQNPDDPNAHYFLALIYQKNNELDQTAKSFREVIRIVPTNLNARYNLASIYEQLNKEDDAMREYRGIIQQGQHTNLAALAKRRLNKVEGRLSGLTFGLDYGLSYDDNINFGKPGAEIDTKIVDGSGTRTLKASLDPVGDLKTEFGLRTSYRNKLTNKWRWEVSLDSTYSVYHGQEFDFIRLGLTPVLSYGAYNNILSFGYSDENSQGLLNEDARAKSNAYRLDFLHRYRQRPWNSWFWGEKDAVATSFNISSMLREFDSSQAAYDTRNAYIAFRLNQATSPGFNTTLVYAFTENDSLHQVGTDFEYFSHTFSFGVQKLLLFGVMASLDYSLNGQFYKNYDLGLFQEDGTKTKRVVLSNNIALRLNYRYHENLSFSLGYQNVLNSANLRVRSTEVLSNVNLLDGQPTGEQTLVDQFQTPMMGSFTKSVLFFSVNLDLQ